MTELEYARIISVCNEPEYAALPPSQIVPLLADRGEYVASESTFYRVLKAKNMLKHRGRTKPRKPYAKPTSFTATGANQVWSWDITYLPTKVIGKYYYLYLFLDIYSRKVVGWEVYERECGELSAQLLERIMLSESCIRKDLVLHSDNGGPMKSYTLKAKMEELGVASSKSRPRVSNDNPYSESLFRTLKYCPTWPSNGFESLNNARLWVKKFTDWYNGIHRHSGIKFVTPNERHKGEDKILLEKRSALYQEKKRENPHRWSGETRNWKTIDTVELNPEQNKVA
jgi:putative transposase